MNRIRNILLILILAFSNQVFADNSNNDVDALLLTVSAGSKLDSKTCEEKNAGHNFACKANAAKTFCEQDLTNATFNDALPFGSMIICNKDVSANAIASQVSYDTLVRTHGLDGREKDRIGKFYDKKGFDKPLASTIEASKANQYEEVVYDWLPWIFGLVILSIITFLLIQLASGKTTFTQAKILTGFIVALILVYLLVGYYSYALMLLFAALMPNFLSSMIISNHTMQGYVDTTDMKPYYDVEMQTFKESFFIGNLEAQSTILNQIRYSKAHYNKIDKRWWPIDLKGDDITVDIKNRYELGFLGAYSWIAKFNNSLFTGFDQTKEVCVQFSKKYNDGVINVNLEKGFDQQLNCLYATDKTKYDNQLDDKSILKELFTLNISKAIVNTALYTEFMYKSTATLEKGVEVGISNATNFEDTYVSIAREYINKDENVFQSDSYKQLVEDGAEKAKDVVVGLDIGFGLKEEEQKAIKSMQSRIYTEGLLGINTVKGEENYWGFDHKNGLNVLNKTVFKPWYKAKRIIECNKLTNIEKVAEIRNKETAMSNSQADFKDMNPDLFCNYKNEDGTNESLISEDPSYVSNAEETVKVYEYAFNIFVHSSQEIGIKAYQNSLSDNSNAREYIENQRLGAMGMFYNAFLIAKAQDMLSRVKDVFKNNTITGDSFNYNKEESYTFVRTEILRDSTVSLPKIKVDSIIAVNTTSSPKDAANSDNDTQLVKVMLDKVLEGFRFRCVNPLNEGDYYGAACADPSYITLFLNTGDIINSSSTIIGGFWFAKVFASLIEAVSGMTTIMGPHAKILSEIAVLLGDAFVFIMGILAKFATFVLLCVIGGMLIYTFTIANILYKFFIIPIVVNIHLMMMLTVGLFYSFFSEKDKQTYLDQLKSLLNFMVSTLVSNMLFWFYLWGASGILNGQITSIIDSFLTQNSETIMFMVITAVAGLIIQTFVKLVVLPYKDLLILGYINTMCQTLFQTVRTSDFGSGEMIATLTAGNAGKQVITGLSNGKAIDKGLENFTGRRKGLTDALNNRRMQNQEKPLSPSNEAPKPQKEAEPVNKTESKKEDVKKETSKPQTSNETVEKEVPKTEKTTETKQEVKGETKNDKNE
ncbi:Uncharacterised protein [Vibrio cholerae]|nr:Uncharacterised protein [Vibrio cholerae]